MGTSVKEVKLCLLGDAGVGKSSIVHRFVYDAFKPAMESTIGAAFLTKSVTLDMVIYKYQIWDTAGQEKYRALAPMYYRGAAAAIIVYDITVEGSFKAVKTWIRELKQYADQDIILAIAGNKCDLEDSREIQSKGKRLSANSERWKKTAGQSTDTLNPGKRPPPSASADAANAKSACCG